VEAVRALLQEQFFVVQLLPGVEIAGLALFFVQLVLC
jgi:hypothetical protein